MRRPLVVGFLLGIWWVPGGCAALPWPGAGASTTLAGPEASPAIQASEHTSSTPQAPTPPDSPVQGRSNSSPNVPPRKDAQPDPASGQADASGVKQPLQKTPQGLAYESSSGPSPEELLALMQELQQLALLDPEAQKLLMEDLAKTDPALWKPLMERFRAALEYHRRLQQSTSPQRRVAKATGSSFQEPREEKNPSDYTSLAGESSGRIPSGGEKPDTLAREGKTDSSVNKAAGSDRREPSQTVSSSERVSSGPQGPAGGALAGYASEAGLAGAERPGLPPPTLAATTATGPMEPFTSLPGETATAASGVKSQQASPSGGASTAQSLSGGQSSRGAEELGWQDRLRVLLRQMQVGLPPSPQTDEEIAQHVYYRLLCLAAGRREEALEPIPGAPPAMQDFWTHEVYAIHLLLDGRQIPDRRQRAAEAKRLFQEAASKLAVAAPLTVKGLAFATEVQSFGCYRGFDNYEFQPGQELLLYAEVENFQSQPTPKGYHTKLRSRFQIFNAEGQPVAEQEFPITEEYCRHMRRDFFIAYPVRLPQDLPPGRYSLKLSLEDLHRNEVCQGSIEFTVRKTGL